MKVKGVWGEKKFSSGRSCRDDNTTLQKELWRGTGIRDIRGFD